LFINISISDRVQIMGKRERCGKIIKKGREIRSREERGM
jgi:hypothetical protein